MRALLEVQDLWKQFGGVRAIDGINWAIGHGETKCIIGPNGAGKSTFFQLLIGRVRPDAGEIRFDDNVVTRRHPFERARLGIAVKPQTLGVFPDLTVEHNLLLSLQRIHHRVDLESQLAERLQFFQLSAKRLAFASTLSQGEKQWLALAMALGSQPKFVLLDEPTAGMSATETEKTVEVIRSAAIAGIAVLVIEHDMAFVPALSVEATVFHAGRVFTSGDISQIEQNEEVQKLYLGQHGADRLRNKERS